MTVLLKIRDREISFPTLKDTEIYLLDQGFTYKEVYRILANEREGFKVKVYLNEMTLHPENIL